MLNVEVDRKTDIAVIEPRGALSKEDFETTRAVVDGYLEENGRLRGVIVNSEDFPGWESFGALLEHFRFVRDHHREVPRVAVVTDSAVGSVMQAVGDHFVAAEVRRFPFDQFRAAEAWILGEASG